MRSGVSLEILSRRLKFRHLALLDALEQTHNMHLAAQQIGLTQPAATKILQDIEQLFGFAIFERLPRDMRPTELGAFVVRYAQQTLNATGKFVEELADMQQGGYGNLLLGAIIDPAPDILSMAIIKIKERRPLLMVRIITHTSDQLLSNLEQKKLDLVIGRYTSPHQHNLFNFRNLTVDPICVVAGPAHPLRHKTNLRMKDLAEWPWILHPMTSPGRKLLEDTFSRHDMRTPANIVETTSVFATLKLLQASDMVATLPYSVIRDYIVHGMLAQLPVTIDRQIDDYGILTRKCDPLSGAAEEFISIICELARNRHAVPAA